ncbi:putative BCCT family transporter [Gordonia hirsuta DSM 44140 = NBRC 16056]|uniref:Putative BCCT family transporter n=1 Tax=Gordonia hirsuta DSM 44140 = NBRC 16056 TaxID=1121927 RepID=L7LB63_9ACTN|nr:BCCT family transporter [Gordonia hirsuta]GAC58154.1 putative BCCT family transporter [Gordonia hirsuta DSM 44140 = NBRC 16056]
MTTTPDSDDTNHPSPGKAEDSTTTAEGTGPPGDPADGAPVAQERQTGPLAEIAADARSHHQPTRTLRARPGLDAVPLDDHIEDMDSDEDIARKLRSQGVQLGAWNLAPRVFWPALLLVVAVVVAASVWPDGTGEVFASIQSWIVEELGWYYVLAIAGFVVFIIIIGTSKLGGITLGRDGEKPEYSTMSWFSMLFAAGMGIGLVFYGVAEPLSYATVSGKPGWDGDTAQIAGKSMAQTFVHWGLHPWAIYAVIGLALAYAIHRRGRPVSIRWAIEPLLGDRVKGWAGDIIDILAVLGTIFGVATSLGLGVQQIAAGMDAIGLVGDPSSRWLLIVLIVGITFLATMSVVSGIGAGIKWLSNINLTLAGILMVTVLALGPTLFIFRNFVESLGYYFGNVLQMSFDVGAFHGDVGQEWYQSWTIFYWGWWISWAPFVGVFIARISRGRTVREFVSGVLLAPTLVGFVWFSVLGGAGLFRQFFGSRDLVAEDAESIDAPATLFQVLEALPLGQFFSVVAIIVIALFFITSSDSGSLVVDMLASGGHPNPPTWSRVLWSLVEGAVAISLLLAGGLAALQSAALATALPFSIVLVMMCVAIVRGLRYEYRKQEADLARNRLDRAAGYITSEVLEVLPEDPRLRNYLDDRIDYRLSRTKPATWLRPQRPQRRDRRRR